MNRTRIEVIITYAATMLKAFRAAQVLFVSLVARFLRHRELLALHPHRARPRVLSSKLPERLCQPKTSPGLAKAKPGLEIPGKGKLILIPKPPRPGVPQ